MPNTSRAMASHNVMYDYTIYGHTPSKPFMPKVVTEQKAQLKKNQRGKKNVK